MSPSLHTYVLDGHTPVREPDLTRWALWFSSANRTVAQTKVGPYLVSTVFLGLDHEFSQHGPPLLFETMLLSENPGADTLGSRSSTWEQAEILHQCIINQVRAHLRRHHRRPSPRCRPHR